MLELLQSLIAYKYAGKLKHWQSSNYGMHLLYDRLIENVDGWVDDIAEKVYMAAGVAEQLNKDILRSELINEDIAESITFILEKIEELLDDEEQPDGVATLLSDISKDFLTKLALARMENGE
nr:MAG TPA: DpsA protein [Caudoviricetes sp.]